MNAPLHALEHDGERSAFASIDGAIEKLRLAPIPMGGNDESPCYLVSYLGAKIAADQMQAEIEPCRTAGGRENLALVDIEHVWVHAHLRVTIL
jgi:hypothetical protein